MRSKPTQTMGFRFPGLPTTFLQLCHFSENGVPFPYVAGYFVFTWCLVVPTCPIPTHFSCFIFTTIRVGLTAGFTTLYSSTTIPRGAVLFFLESCRPVSDLILHPPAPQPFFGLKTVLSLCGQYELTFPRRPTVDKLTSTLQ